MGIKCIGGTCLGVRESNPDLVDKISSATSDSLSYDEFRTYTENARCVPQMRPLVADCYNRCIAPKAPTLVSSFNIWATDIAYMHPLGLTLDLILQENDDHGYGSEYFCYRRHVNGFGLSAFLFLPLMPGSSRNPKEPKTFCAGRAIVLFRGTTDNPAWFPERGYFPEQLDFLSKDFTGFVQETKGWRTDFNPAGVGIDAFWRFKNQLRYWLDNEAKSREVTYVGHSLGGNLSLRAQHEHSCYAARHSFVPSHSEVFAFHPPGVDIWTKTGLNYLPAASRHIFVHPRDHVSNCGFFPKAMFQIASEPAELKNSSPDALHILPLAALKQVWNWSPVFTPRDYRAVPLWALLGEAVRFSLSLHPFNKA